MSRNKTKRLTTILSIVSLFALASCDDDHIRYPNDYEDPLYNIEGVSDIYGNTKEQYYENLATDEINSKVLDKVLVKISKMAHDYTKDHKGTDVSDLVSEHVLESTSDDNKGTATTKDKMSNLERRAQKNMADVAIGGSYSKNGLFYEHKYARYLQESFYYLPKDLENQLGSKEGKFIVPTYEYKDIYGEPGTNSASNLESYYATYREKENYEANRINYLTAEYIYTKQYTAIGNSNARKVQIIALEDRSEGGAASGYARNLLNAYINKYIKGKNNEFNDPNFKGDPDFKILQRLWKGLTQNAADSIAKGRYEGTDVILHEDEEKFLRDNNILPEKLSISGPQPTEEDIQKQNNADAIGSNTLVGKVLLEKKKLENNDTKEWYEIEDTLESTYTSSYSNDLETGFRNSVDEIVKKNLITEGLYLKSSGITNIPTGLSDRIFTDTLTNKESELTRMKKEGKESDTPFSADITKYCKDGYRYVTIADTIPGTNDDIMYYDTSSKTYYLTRILDVVNTNGLKEGASDTVYSNDKESGKNVSKREQLAREVAYELSTTGSYKSDSIVYWLSRTKMDFKDENFLKYIEDNYKDVFKTKNPYADEPKIDLKG